MTVLRIGVDIRDLRIAKTGARTYLEELVREFKLIKDPQIEFFFYDTAIRVYTGRNKALKLIEHLRYFFWKQIELPFRAAFNKCDILFCTDYFVPYIHLGYKTIPVFHDAFFFEYPHHYNKIWLFLFRTIGISAAKRSYSIVTPTFYTRSKISELSGIAEQKIQVVYEGPKTFSNKKDRKLKVGPDKYLLHVGTMEIRKNIINLLKAYSLIAPAYPGLKLVLIGQFSPKITIDDRKAILNHISQNNLEADVIFPGYVNDEELQAYYENALAYVFPSLNEGFGIPILEAFGAGIPVLVSDNTCLPEVGGDAVISFNPYDPEDIGKKLRSVLDNPLLQAEMVSKGYQRLKSFTWKNASDHLITIFKEACR